MNRFSIAVTTVMLLLLAAVFGFPLLNSLLPNGYAANKDLEFHWVKTGDDRLQYALGLPEKNLPGQAQRLLLALPPGRQDAQAVRRGLFRWLPYLLKHGWLVVSPIAPRGKMFFKGAETQIPALLDHIAEKYGSPGAKFHVFGISNGGISAFRVATLYPERVRSVTVVPGYASPDDFRRLEKLKHIPVTIAVGGRDTGWVIGGKAARARLEELGGDVLLEIIPGGSHFIFGRIPPERVVKWITRYSAS